MTYAKCHLSIKVSEDLLGPLQSNPRFKIVKMKIEGGKGKGEGNLYKCTVNVL